MAQVHRPTDMSRQLAQNEKRRVYALWHRNEPPARVVVDKFSRKLKRYGFDRHQRQVEWSNFAESGKAGDAAVPDPQLDGPGAQAYLRQQLDNIDDVVVFYSDRLGDPDDALGRLTGSELEFVFDPGMRGRLRYWFGGVHTIDLELAQIGKCSLRLVPWNRLPPGGEVFNWADPDGKLDSEVGTSLTLLLGEGSETPGPAPAPAPPSPPPDSGGGGWLGRLFGRRG
jgi:hypothetical protein